MGSRHSSGPSSYEIAAKQAKAEKAEQERIAAEKASRIAAANASAAGGEATGGEAGPYSGGALTRKKGSTLAGEGEQTFGGNGSLGG